MSFGTRGDIHSVLQDPHENPVQISGQNLGQKNVFKPASYNRDNGGGSKFCHVQKYGNQDTIFSHHNIRTPS